MALPTNERHGLRRSFAKRHKFVTGGCANYFFRDGAKHKAVSVPALVLLCLTSSTWLQIWAVCGGQRHATKNTAAVDGEQNLCDRLASYSTEMNWSRKIVVSIPHIPTISPLNVIGMIYGDICIPLTSALLRSTGKKNIAMKLECLT